jgi:hypothetical protein
MEDMVTFIFQIHEKKISSNKNQKLLVFPALTKYNAGEEFSYAYSKAV